MKNWNTTFLDSKLAETASFKWYCVRGGPWVYSLQRSWKSGVGPPSLHTRGLQLEPRGQVVSLKFFRHVLMFLQLAEGHGFPDQDAKVSSKQQLCRAAKSTLSDFCHTDETAIFHNKSRLLAIVKKTTRIRFFITVRKGLWENTSKKKATDGGRRTKPHSWVNTHVQTLTCTTQANLCWRGNVRSEYVLRCTRVWGRSSDNPTCKTTAAKFPKCLEFRSVSHPSLAQANQRQPVCTCVDVRSPLPSSVNRKVYLSFYFPNFLITLWQRVTTMQIGATGWHESNCSNNCPLHNAIHALFMAMVVC